MGAESLDCTWCGSARSIEYGICQICLMEYPLETQVIPLPQDRVAFNRSQLMSPDRGVASGPKTVLDRTSALDRTVTIDRRIALDRKSARSARDRLVDLTDEPTLEIAE
jgi:hypothetical protein